MHRYLLSNDEYYCLKRFMACPVWSLLEDWYDSLGMAEEVGGSGSQEAGCGECTCA